MSDALSEALEVLGVRDLGAESVRSLEAFAELLRMEAVPRGFVGRATSADLETLHLADSLAAIGMVDRLAELGAPPRVADVGSGAGLPGIPLKIARPQLRMTLLESSRKRCEFLRRAAELLGLAGVEVVQGRAEEAGRQAKYRERFDLVLARALGPAAEALEYCLPLVRVGGKVALYKTAAQTEEAVEAQSVAAALGGFLDGFEEYELPGLKQGRYLAVFSKRSATPDKFPRRSGAPRKRPVATPNANRG